MILTSLSTEVLSHSFQFLPFKDLRSLAMSSRRLYAEANSDLLWCLLCRRAGLLGVMPAGSCAWRSFASRIGVTSGSYPTGSWVPLVGFTAAHDVQPVTLHPGSGNLPWASLLQQKASRKLASSFHTASVGLITVSSSPLARETETSVILTTGLFSKPNVMSPLASGGLNYSAPSPQLHYFDCAPLLDDTTRALFLRLSGVDVTNLNAGAEHGTGSAVANHRRVARLVEGLWSGCSTLIFIYSSEKELRTWLEAVGAEFSTPILDDSIFCAGHNTPEVYFLCTSKTTDQQPEAGGVSKGNNNSFSRPPSTSQVEKSLPDFFPNLPLPLRLTLALRTSGFYFVTEDLLYDYVMPIPKRYCLPAWVDCAATPSFLPFHVLEMVADAVVASPGVAPRDSMWTAERMQSVLTNATRKAVEFYVDAMRTEIDDHSQKGKVPLDASDLVLYHRHFFFACLRNFSMQATAVCGRNIAGGLHLLENLKREIHSAFRDLSRENQNLSKRYCMQVFERIFNPVQEEFLEGTGFDSPTAVATWQSFMQKKIALYCKAAPGPRSMEVLVTQMEAVLLPKFLDYCISRPNHRYLRHPQLVTAINEITSTVRELLRKHQLAQEATTEQMQTETAAYTAATGNEWAANAFAEVCSMMLSLRPFAEEWASDLESRCRELALTNLPQLEQVMETLPQPGATTPRDRSSTPRTPRTPSSRSLTESPVDGSLSLTPRRSQQEQLLAALRLQEIHRMMAREGEQRALSTRSQHGVATSAELREDLAVVHHPRPSAADSFFDSVRRRLAGVRGSRSQ